MPVDEQERLFAELPEHLQEMAIDDVNTGCRDAQVCGLRREWEIPAPELETSVLEIRNEGVCNYGSRKSPALLVLEKKRLEPVAATARRAKEIWRAQRDSNSRPLGS